jgi:hypothetical protein
MGFNTTLLILNDAMGEIDKDPAGWWQKTQRQLYEPPNTDYGFGHHGNGFRVVANSHADMVNVIAVGGNYASILGTIYNGNHGHHEVADQLRILREVEAKIKGRA